MYQLFHYFIKICTVLGSCNNNCICFKFAFFCIKQRSDFIFPRKYYFGFTVIHFVNTNKTISAIKNITIIIITMNIRGNQKITKLIYIVIRFIFGRCNKRYRIILVKFNCVFTIFCRFWCSEYSAFILVYNFFCVFN